MKNPTPEQLRLAYHRGKRCFAHKYDKSHNPYGWGTKLWNQYNEGYDRGAREAE